MKFAVVDWFRAELDFSFSQDRILAWLIGSVASEVLIPRDCDILVIFESTHIQKMISYSEIWRTKFFNKFDLELHLTRITFEELKDWQLFLNFTFKKEFVPIYPYTR